MRVEKQNKKIEQDYKLSCHISLPKSRNFESSHPDSSEGLDISAGNWLF
jgi:hypothetical protein